MIRPAESQVYMAPGTSSTTRPVSCLGEHRKQSSIPPPTASSSIACAEGRRSQPSGPIGQGRPEATGPTSSRLSADSHLRIPC